MIDLEIGEPYEGYVDQDPPRTDVLHHLRRRLDLTKVTMWSQYNQRVITVPPIGADRYITDLGVRFIKTCERWHSFRDFGGENAHYQCLGAAALVGEATDEQDGSSYMRLCVPCADEILIERDMHESYGVTWEIRDCAWGTTVSC